MSDKDDKVVSDPIDMKSFARARRNKSDKQIRQQTWEAVGELWANYHGMVENAPRSPDGFNLSNAPSSVFYTLAEELVLYAQALGVENNLIMECLLGLALTECEPKGRLYQLIHKASNLLTDGDEDSSEKALRWLHAQGKLTDEQLEEGLHIPTEDERRES